MLLCFVLWVCEGAYSARTGVHHPGGRVARVFRSRGHLTGDMAWHGMTSRAGGASASGVGVLQAANNNLDLQPICASGNVAWVICLTFVASGVTELA